MDAAFAVSMIWRNEDLWGKTVEIFELTRSVKLDKVQEIAFCFCIYINYCQNYINQLTVIVIVSAKY